MFTTKICNALKYYFTPFVVSLLLHLLIVVILGHYKQPLIWESGGIAENMLKGKGFCISYARPDEPTSWQAPGYPFLLLIMWKIFGQTQNAYLILSLFQALLISTIVFPVGSLTERWFDIRTAAIARWIACFMPLYGWYPTRIVQASLVMTLHPWLLYGWLILANNESRSGWQIFLVGLLTGIGGLFQPIILMPFGILTIICGFKQLIRGHTKAFWIIISTGIIVLLSITPWTIRNYYVHGKLIPIKNSFGKELWMGNNPHATGSAFVEGGIDITIAYPPASYKMIGHVSEIELMDALFKESVHYIIQDPAAFIWRFIKKVMWFWSAVPKSLLRSTGDAEAIKFWYLHVGYWSFFLIMILASRLFGGRFHREYALCLLIYVFVYSIIYGLTIVGNARFRGEMEYIFIPAVSAGIYCTYRKICALYNRNKSQPILNL